MRPGPWRLTLLTHSYVILAGGAGADRSSCRRGTRRSSDCQLPALSWAEFPANSATDKSNLHGPLLRLRLLRAGALLDRTVAGVRVAVATGDRRDIGTRPGLFDLRLQGECRRLFALLFERLLEPQESPRVVGMPFEVRAVDLFGLGVAVFGQQQRAQGVPDRLHPAGGLVVA